MEDAQLSHSPTRASTNKPGPAHTGRFSALLLEAWQVTPLALIPKPGSQVQSSGSAPGWMNRITGQLREVRTLPHPLPTQRFQRGYLGTGPGT